MPDKNFPADFVDIGRGLFDADKLIINNRSADASRIRTYTVGASDGSTVGSPWEAIVDTQGDVTLLQTAVFTAQGDITTLQTDVSTAQGDITTLQTDVSTIQGDITTLQTDVASALVNADFAGTHTGGLLRTGVGLYAVRRDNMAASAAPTVTDDNTAGYIVGSLWYDTTGQEAYTALDVSTGAAVWKIMTATGGATSDILFEWNKTDLSQFDFGNLASNAGGAITLGTGGNWYNVFVTTTGQLAIRQGTFIAGGDYLAFPVNPTALSEPLPSSYTISMTIEGRDTTIDSTDCYVGAMTSWRTSDRTGRGFGTSRNVTGGITPVIKSGAVTNFNGGGTHFTAPWGSGNVRRGGNYVYNIENVDPALGYVIPVGDTHGYSWWWGTANDIYRRDNTNPFYDADAIWTGYTPDTVGIIYDATSAASGTTMLISEFIVRKYKS